jgi:hypothetical protein
MKHAHDEHDEYLKEMNNHALSLSMKSLIEVKSLKDAIQASENMIKVTVSAHSSESFSKIKKSHAISQINFNNKLYICVTYVLNGAHILLRATDPISKKFYIPTEVHVVISDEITDKPSVEKLFGLDPNSIPQT